MLGENKNLRDSSTESANLSVAIKDNSTTLTYTKTSKLITALFMVTDIMDREEPLRNKLRILGTNIISDMHSSPINSDQKISEILSFLDIGSAIGIISNMNSNILKKEFGELKQSIRDFASPKNPTWLTEFMKDGGTTAEVSLQQSPKLNISKMTSIGHPHQTRIGVQKGSTLMKALRDVRLPRVLSGVEGSDRVSSMPISKLHSPLASASQPKTPVSNASYDILKKKRREEVISIIKNKLAVFPQSGGATITDIKNSAEGPLVSCGEKTLQRELVSMVHDGVLYKTGEKRWSKYSTKSV